MESRITSNRRGVHAVGDGGVGEVGGLGAEVGVVHAAGDIGAIADEGVSAGVVWNAGGVGRSVFL